MTSIEKGGVTTGGSSRACPPREAADRQMAERFRAAIVREEKKAGSAETERAAPREGKARPGGRDSELGYADRPPILPGPVPPALFAPPADAKDDKRAILPSSPMHAATEVARPVTAPQRPGSPAPSAAEFSALLSRLDAGVSPSTLTQLNLPGPGWTVHQVILAQQIDKMAVLIDPDRRAPTSPQSLESLQRRLQSRGIRSQIVSNPIPGMDEEGDFRLVDGPNRRHSDIG